jgi:hypothetical protein
MTDWQTTERMQDIELEEKLSDNVKAGFADVHHGLQTVQQAIAAEPLSGGTAWIRPARGSTIRLSSF